MKEDQKYKILCSRLGEHSPVYQYVCFPDGSRIPLVKKTVIEQDSTGRTFSIVTAAVSYSSFFFSGYSIWPEDGQLVVRHHEGGRKRVIDCTILSVGLPVTVEDIKNGAEAPYCEFKVECVTPETVQKPVPY